MLLRLARALPSTGAVLLPFSPLRVMVFFTASTETTSAVTSWVFTAGAFSAAVALAGAAAFSAGLAASWASATPATKTSDSSNANFFIFVVLLKEESRS
jgi:hypothetical protein